jgi:hypothetical protein
MKPRTCKVWPECDCAKKLVEYDREARRLLTVLESKPGLSELVEVYWSAREWLVYWSEHHADPNRRMELSLKVAAGDLSRHQIVAKAKRMIAERRKMQ